MPYPAALGQRPLEVREAYAALEQYAADYGREPLLLLMHAAVAETLRADLLNLIRVNFLPGRRVDLSLEADVLFSPLSISLGGGYYRLDAQVRWHGLALLRSLYRDDSRPRERRVAELLWRYVQVMERRASRAGDPRLAEFLAIQRWVALAFLEPASAAHAFAEALREVGDAPATALLRLGGLTSAIELPLASEQTLLAYARAMDALVSGDDERSQTLAQTFGEHEIRVGGVVLTPPTRLWRQWQPPEGDEAAGRPDEASRHKVCLVLIGAGKKALPDRRVLDLDQAYRMIRTAVTGLAMDCLRLDDLRSADDSGGAVYQRLLDADLVVCDLSRYDDALAYLLGVRLALRPSRTLVVAEQSYRGTVGNLTQRLLRYETQDDGIAIEERARFVDRLRSIVSEEDHDYLRSDVYADGSLLPPESVDAGVAGKVSATVEIARREGSRARCLVLQAFGVQSALATGRSYSYDESYPIIREAADSLGLNCVRFDIHESRAIDGPMLRLLQEAELVIGDVSSKVEHVLLSLGIRFGLCPTGTLLIAAQDFIPIQFAKMRILRYQPMGMAPGIEDAAAFQSALAQRIKEALTTSAVDSPVYLALPTLRPARPRTYPDVEGTDAIDDVWAAEDVVTTPKILVIYSHHDSEALKAFQPFLKPLERDGLVRYWDDTLLKSGDDWYAEIEEALAGASVAVLFISQHFLASDFIVREELPRLLAREHAGQLKLLPVFLGPSTVADTDFTFADPQGKPRKTKLDRQQGYGTPQQPLSDLTGSDRQREYWKLSQRIRELAEAAATTAALPEALPANRLTSHQQSSPQATSASRAESIHYELAVQLERRDETLATFLPVPGFARLTLNRDEQKALVAKHLREFVRSDTGRVMALVAYAAPGNLLGSLPEQLQYYLDREAADYAESNWRRLQFPVARQDLFRDLENELKLQLQSDGSEAVRHLLRRHAPNVKGLAKRAVLWLNWGLFGAGADAQPPFTLAQMGEWLRFSSEFLTAHCPDDLRIVSFLAIELDADKHQKLADDLGRQIWQPWCANPLFRLDSLPPLGSVTERDAFMYLLDKRSGCDPSLRQEIGQRLIARTGGEFAQVVALIEEAQNGSWYDLLARLRREQGASPPPDDNDMY